jgi:hypothetical protein
VSVEVEAPPPSEAAAPDTSIARREHLTIDRSISRDRFFWVRVAALSAYGIGYVWWFRANGLIIDRISVAVSVAIFLGCAFAGKPWRRWATLVIDAALYALMWFCYEMTRGAADHLGFPLQVHYARNLDRALFFGTDPNVWIQQRFYDPRDVKWYDNVASRRTTRTSCSRWSRWRCCGPRAGCSGSASCGGSRRCSPSRARCSS